MIRGKTRARLPLLPGARALLPDEMGQQDQENDHDEKERRGQSRDERQGCSDTRTLHVRLRARAADTLQRHGAHIGANVRDAGVERGKRLQKRRIPAVDQRDCSQSRKPSIRPSASIATGSSRTEA